MHQPITFTRLQLKYCERCGGLFLRREGTDSVFCGTCAHAMAGSPGSGRKPCEAATCKGVVAGLQPKLGASGPLRRDPPLPLQTTLSPNAYWRVG